MKKGYWSKLALFSDEKFTKEGLGKMFVRPFGLILMPSIMWGMLVMSVLIGFNVAISSSCVYSSLYLRGGYIDFRKLRMISRKRMVSLLSKAGFASLVRFLVVFSEVRIPFTHPAKTC